MQGFPFFCTFADELIKHFGSVKKFTKQIINDNEKKKRCQKQGVKLLFYSKYKKENVITNLTILKEKIYDI